MSDILEGVGRAAPPPAATRPYEAPSPPRPGPGVSLSLFHGTHPDPPSPPCQSPQCPPRGPAGLHPAVPQAGPSPAAAYGWSGSSPGAAVYGWAGPSPAAVYGTVVAPPVIPPTTLMPNRVRQPTDPSSMALLSCTQPCGPAFRLPPGTPPTTWAPDPVLHTDCDMAGNPQPRAVSHNRDQFGQFGQFDPFCPSRMNHMQPLATVCASIWPSPLLHSLVSGYYARFPPVVESGLGQ